MHATPVSRFLVGRGPWLLPGVLALALVFIALVAGAFRDQTAAAGVVQEHWAAPDAVTAPAPAPVVEAVVAEPMVAAAPATDIVAAGGDGIYLEAIDPAEALAAQSAN